LLLLMLQPISAFALQKPDADGISAGRTQDAHWQVEQDMQVAQSGGKTLSQAVEQVKRQNSGGRIISAETKRSGNREVHHIKVLTKEGKVRTVRVQGRTLSSRG